MKDEYIIVNKTLIQKRIEELEKQLNTLGHTSQEEIHAQGYLSGKIQQIREILSQSTPLIPEIEKSWEHGYTRGYNLAYCEGTNSECLTPNKQDYISNLKLDI